MSNARCELCGQGDLSTVYVVHPPAHVAKAPRIQVCRPCKVKHNLTYKVSRQRTDNKTQK
jgi:hypothetical protein